MLITFKQTRRLSEDGYTVKRFEKDTTHDVAHSAAAYAISQGWAELAEPDDVETVMNKLIASLRVERLKPVGLIWNGEFYHA